MQHHQFIRMQPELLIQTVMAAKILEEQREARTNQSPFNFGYFLYDLRVKNIPCSIQGCNAFTRNASSSR